MTKKSWRDDGVPFCGCGLMHYHHKACFDCRFDDGNWYSDSKGIIEFRDCIPFQDKMQLIDNINSGRSAKYLTLQSQTTELKYTLFVRDLLDIVLKFGVEKGGIISGTFDYVKRGTNYGVTLIDV